MLSLREVPQVKARIERDWANAMVRVWLFEPRETGTRVLRILGKDVYQWDDVENGALLPEPTLYLPDEALQELVREASNVVPVEDATSAHLQDAIEVRDRLLSLVEKRR